MKCRKGLKFSLALGISSTTAPPSSATLASPVLRCVVDNDRIHLLPVLPLRSNQYLLGAIRLNLSTFDNIVETFSIACQSPVLEYLTKQTRSSLFSPSFRSISPSPCWPLYPRRTVCNIDERAQVVQQSSTVQCICGMFVVRTYCVLSDDTATGAVRFISFRSVFEP